MARDRRHLFRAILLAPFLLLRINTFFSSTTLSSLESPGGMLDAAVQVCIIIVILAYAVFCLRRHFRIAEFLDFEDGVIRWRRWREMNSTPAENFDYAELLENGLILRSRESKVEVFVPLKVANERRMNELINQVSAIYPSLHNMLDGNDRVEVGMTIANKTVGRIGLFCICTFGAFIFSLMVIAFCNFDLNLIGYGRTAIDRLEFAVATICFLTMMIVFLRTVIMMEFTATGVRVIRPMWSVLLPISKIANVRVVGNRIEVRAKNGRVYRVRDSNAPEIVLKRWLGNFRAKLTP
jgi:hypothetical protein